MNLRNLFPILKNNPNLIYFDSAATALKLKSVIKAETDFLSHCGANPHSDSFPQAVTASEILEQSRSRVATFIGAKSAQEIVFNSGTTQGLNQVAFGVANEIHSGDEILLTELEHASNLLPWMTIANQKKAKIRMMPLTEDYQINQIELIRLLSPKTKIVAFASSSNTVGVLNDVSALAKVIRQHAPQALIVIDAAQTIAHNPINVQEWDIDFLTFSFHKIFGPFGLGVLWSRAHHLNKMLPLLYGGGMLHGIKKSLRSFYPTHGPAKFEAGTPNISAIATIPAVLNFVEGWGWTKIMAKERHLRQRLESQIKKFNLTQKFDFYNLNLETNLLIFNSKQWPAHEVANWLGFRHHIAVRSGTHCAWLTDRLLGVSASVRLSLSLYNNEAEIDKFVSVLQRIDQEMPGFIFKGR